MNSYLGYRFAFYAALSLAAVNLTFLAYVSSYSPHYTSAASIHAVVAALITFGLWVQSKIARYLGAAWSLLSLASVVWPVASGSRIVWSVGLLWFVSLGVLSFALVVTLLFSRKFAVEFAYERNRQPVYKRILRNIAIALVIVAAIVATLNDIHHLLAL